MPTLQARAADVADHREPDGYRPTSVEQRNVAVVDGTSFRPSSVETREPKAHAARQEREQTPERRARDAHSHAVQHALNQRFRFVDVPRTEQLVGCPALELESPRLVALLSCGEIGARRGSAETGAGKRIAQFFAQDVSVG